MAAQHRLVNQMLLEFKVVTHTIFARPCRISPPCQAAITFALVVTLGPTVNCLFL